MTSLDDISERNRRVGKSPEILFGLLQKSSEKLWEIGGTQLLQLRLTRVGGGDVEVVVERVVDGVGASAVDKTAEEALQADYVVRDES